ncbi:GFA family protein [Stenotrophomonas acidaminiphila]
MFDRPRATCTGSCHCGAVRFEITSDFPELTTCDCSICRRKNALMVKVHESDFRLLAGEEQLAASSIPSPPRITSAGPAASIRSTASASRRTTTASTCSAWRISTRPASRCAPRWARAWHSAGGNTALP